MTFDASFPALWGLFGGSIYRDEYKGNFAEANRQIEAQLHEKLDELASIQLAKAVHGLLSGHVGEAEEILNRMGAKDSMFSPKWQLRAEIYRRIILEKGTLLRAFDGCLDLPAFQTKLHNCLKSMNPSRKPELEASWTEELIGEDTWMNPDLYAVKLRTMASQIPKTSPIHPQGGSEKQQNMVTNLGHILAGFHLPGCPAGYGLRLQAEMAHIQGSRDSLQLLAKAAEAYRNQNQFAGEASCIMREGDFLCSQQYSNITALNMVIYESTSHTGSDERWDATEDGIQFKQADKARRLYTAAQRLFEASSAPRGVGAIHMRMACLTIFETLLGGKEKEMSGKAPYGDARRDLQYSFSAFQSAGDYLSVKLVETHMIILDILSSGVSRTAAAAEIGVWGKQNGNFQYVHDLGLLFLRLGMYVWRNKSTFDTTLLLLEAAQAIFANLDARGSEIQAEAARGEILSEVLDLVAVRVTFLSAERKLDELMEMLRTRVPPQLWRPECELVKLRLNTSMVVPFFYLGDATTLKRLLGKVQGSPDDVKTNKERVAKEPSLILYLAKLQYREKIQEDNMTGALQCLEGGLKALSALDAELYGEHLQVARINILGEMMRYEEARIIVREMSIKNEKYNKLETDIAAFNMDSKKHLTIKFYKTLLRLAMNSLDFKLANNYVQKLESLGDGHYSKKGPNELPQSPEALYTLGCLHEGLKDLEVAIICVNAHLDAIEATRSDISDLAVRATSFGHNEVFEVFDTAVRICVQLHGTKNAKLPSELTCNPPLEGPTWIEQALIFAERGKARAMLDSVRARFDLDSQDKVQGVQRQISDFRRRKLMEQMAKSVKVISRLENQLGQGNSEDPELVKKQLLAEKSHLNSLEVEFAQIGSLISNEESLQSLASVRAYSDNLDILGILKYLPSNTVVLEYATTYNGVAIFAIEASGIVASHWVDIRKIDLQQQILDFMWLMRDENREVPDRLVRCREIVQFLTASLIDPVSSVLAKQGNVIFVPSGTLFNFPLCVLEMSSEPLMLSHTVSQVPSLAVWYELRKIRQTSEESLQSKPSMAVFCNSYKVNDGLNFVRAEALAIAQLSSVSPIVTDKTSLSRFRHAGRGCDVLHYCSHGNFDRDAPLLSSLQLLPKDAPESPSILDLVTMIGPAKLVVLSACFSGFGKVLGSNDGYGFPHALLAIGVRAFVGSLWKTDDSAAMIFMFIFYREILNEQADDNITIAQAFATAQRQLRNMSRASYSDCIDQIILGLQKCDSRISKRIVRMSEQIGWLNFWKNEKDPARFADPFYWAAFVLTGDGAQILTSSAKTTSLSTRKLRVDAQGNQEPARGNLMAASTSEMAVHEC